MESIASLFGTTRDVIKRHTRHCLEFTKIAVVVLNQIIRPFSTKWHKLALAGAFKEPQQCDAFRKELAALQIQLTRYTGMLGSMAGVEEDLTLLERFDEEEQK